MYIAAPPTLPIACPALFARFLVGPVFFQDPAFIGKDAGGERKGDAVFFPIQAVLSFVPFQPHVYIVYIYSGRRSKCKLNRGGRQMPTLRDASRSYSQTARKSAAALSQWAVT